MRPGWNCANPVRAASMPHAPESACWRDGRKSLMCRVNLLNSCLKEKLRRLRMMILSGSRCLAIDSHYDSFANR
jgi:hypothetical protein